jgi:hypothetical protein
MTASTNCRRSDLQTVGCRLDLRRWLISTLLASVILIACCARAQTPRISWAGQLTDAAYMWELYNVIDAAVDPQGNVAFTGWFYDPTLTFGSQTVTNLGLPQNVGYDEQNGFVAKYNSAGNLLWVQRIGGNQGDQMQACAADAAGNVFVTGSLYSTNVWFGTNLVVKAGGRAAFFLAKFGPQGNLIWVRQVAGFLGAGSPYGNSVAVDGAGNIHVGGSLYQGSITFGTNVLSNPYNGGATNPYPAQIVAEYTGAGDVIWARIVSFNGYDYGPVFAVDAQGNTYLSDSFPGVANFGSLVLTNTGGAEGSTLFLAKYDPAGNFVWANPVAVSSLPIYSWALAVGPQEDCHILGRYAPDATFGTVALPTTDSYGNGFIAKYDAAGGLAWADPILVVGSGGDVVGANLIVDPMDNCWAIGTVFSPTVTIGGITLTNSGSQDGHCFVVKYQPSGNPLWAKILDSPGVYTHALGLLDSAQDLFLYGEAAGTNVLNLDGILVDGPTTGETYYFAAKIDGPALTVQSVGGQLVISWPTNAVGLSLESSLVISGGNWSPVTNAPAVVGDQFAITNDISAGSRFYRLRNF